MKKCNLCNSENLMKSSKESRLVPGANYVACKSCGNVMMLSNDVLIPTPQQNNAMVKTMIEDAANAFSENGLLMGVSLTGRNFENDVQPTTVQNLVQDYVNNYIDSMEELKEDMYCCDDCDFEDDSYDCYDDCDDCDCCDCDDFIDFDDEDEEENYEYLKKIPITNLDKEMSITNLDKEISLKTASTLNKEGKDYLLIKPSGEKIVFKNCSKEFLLNIINDMKVQVEVFELNEIKLKQEVKYSF